MNATNAVHVDSSNSEQLRAWDGDEGDYWADNAEHFDRGIAAHHERLLATAAIGARDHVLDVGCGTGQTTRDAARAASAGSARGVDLSSRMLDYARRRATEEGVTNATFAQADAQIHPFEPGAYDVAISRTAAMFFGDHVAAFTNIGRALRPDGRPVLVTWQPLPGNEWIREISAALAGGRDRPAPPPDAGPDPAHHHAGHRRTHDRVLRASARRAVLTHARPVSADIGRRRLRIDATKHGATKKKETVTMTTIHVVLDSSLPPQQVLHAARNFSNQRAAVFPAVSMKRLAVHEQGATSADVTEGTRAGPVVNWERCHCHWSEPGLATATVTDSNVYALPSSWRITATATSGGSRVEMWWIREFRTGPRGRVFGTAFRLVGTRIFPATPAKSSRTLSDSARQPSSRQPPPRRPEACVPYPSPCYGLASGST